MGAITTKDWLRAMKGTRIMPGNLTKTTTVLVSFECEAESHDLRDFQKAGHFVSGLTDAAGFRRQWETDEVHVLTLTHQGEQVLRVMADTPEEAERMLRDELPRTLVALWTAQFSTGFTFAQWTELNDLRNQFQMFINSHYAWEIERGKHQHFKSVFDVAVHYMRQERNRFVNKLARLIRRQKPVVSSEWIPPEWRA